MESALGISGCGAGGLSETEKLAYAGIELAAQLGMQKLAQRKKPSEVELAAIMVYELHRLGDRMEQGFDRLYNKMDETERRLLDTYRERSDKICRAIERVEGKMDAARLDTVAIKQKLGVA